MTAAGKGTKEEATVEQESTLAQSASLLIALQISTRLLTFALNQLLVRLTDPSVFGAANVQLDLLLSTILFLARDGVRGGLIRSRPTSSSAKANTKNAHLLPAGLHNIALLPIPAGLCIASLASFLYVTRLAPAELSKRFPTEFNLSVGLYVLGAVLELLAEPFYNRAAISLDVPLRVKAEGAAVLAKGVATLAWMLTPPQMITSSSSGSNIGHGLVAFGLGQAAYGAATLCVFIWAYARAHGPTSILAVFQPRQADKPGQARLDKSTLSLTWVLVKQSLLKHSLTESDKLAVAKLGSLSDQGGYALASNYGSLVARMLFQPLEESSRLVFSTQLGAIQPGSASTLSPSSSSLQTSISLLETLLYSYTLLSIFLLSFAPPLALPGLFLLAGKHWATATTAPTILGAYASVYLPVMGFNGILEGFLQATASERELGNYSVLMVGSSAAFVLALFFGSSPSASSNKSGETALVYANSLALAIRAIWSWVYVVRFISRGRSLPQAPASDSTSQKGNVAATTNAAPVPSSTALHPASILPTVPTLVTFLLVGLYLRHDSFPGRGPASATLTFARLGDVLPFLVKGGACAIVCFTSIVVFERSRLRPALSAIRRRRS
ncbi:Oligosaccharide translocation protein rft1 [Tilletia horrida]|uniref:Man(5)GlcNAc(2)-PP-dolichol translocation protein RFT1 n=1 Tax=Tilletia horrida TaxID=155126 RepID=A0AAN6K0P4_9BASI|nr:Oligosaccharide translocation protein rft1 [Tilletia horrida]